MGQWATGYIKTLQDTGSVEFRPRGNSMLPKIRSGDLVRVETKDDIKVKDVVLCRVGSSHYLHFVAAIDTSGENPRYRIENASGRVNGWIGKENIYGVLVSNISALDRQKNI